MIHYIIQTIAFQLFFLIIYDLFLKKETFFNWNRTYLLVTAICSLIIPFIKISSFKNIISQDYIVNLPEIFIGSTNQSEVNPIQLSPITIDNPFWTWDLFFFVGAGLATILFAFKLVKLMVLLYENPKQKIGNLFIVSLLKSNMAFSFFNYIFLGDNLKNHEREAVLKHEMVHIKEKHTWDLLFFEVLRILFWFNPLVYMYQNRIMSLHEFIADAQAVKSHSKNQYYQSLLSQVFETKNISFINPFFKQSLIKKRIIMLQKSKSKQVKLFKYVLIIPVILGMLAYTSSLEALNSKNVSLEKLESKGQDETPLIKKIKSVKDQIQVQGNISDVEEQGLNLLLAVTKGENLDQNLIDKVSAYTIQQTDSKLVKQISEVFEQIQMQGNITDEENKALKSLLVLTSDDGFNDPFFADVLKYVDIPFGLIDQVPVFPGCENLSNKEQRKCMSMRIAKHVNFNFNIKVADSLKLKGKQRINVIFKISNEGHVVDVRSRAPHPDLEDEAIRVINTLPKFIPGEHQGKQVNVPYSLPIIFEIAEKKGE